MPFLSVLLCGYGRKFLRSFRVIAFKNPKIALHHGKSEVPARKNSALSSKVWRARSTAAVFPIKRVMGEKDVVEADVFTDKTA